MHIEGVKAPPIEVMKGTAFGSSNIQPHPSHIRLQQVIIWIHSGIREETIQKRILTSQASFYSSETFVVYKINKLLHNSFKSKLKM